MSHGTPSVTSPISLQELAWQHGLTATQETPIPVQRLHVADTGGVTRLAVPLHLSLGITHGDRSHSLKLSTLPHSSHASSMAVCNVLGPCKGTLHPTLLGAGTLLSQGISTSLLLLPAKRLLTWDLHHALREAGVGSWGKGRWIWHLSRKQLQHFSSSHLLPITTAYLEKIILDLQHLPRQLSDAAECYSWDTVDNGQMNQPAEGIMVTGEKKKKNKSRVPCSGV